MLDKYIVHQCRNPEYIEFLKQLVDNKGLHNPALGITKMILAGNSMKMSTKQTQVFKYYVYNKFKDQRCKICGVHIPWKDMADAVCSGYLCYTCFGKYAE